MAKIVLSLGSNIEPRISHLRQVVETISDWAIKGTIASSQLYETEPNGFNSQNEFINMVISFNAGLSPLDLLQKINNLEQGHGRIRNKGITEDRTIDIDILFYDDLIFENENLMIPHPRLHLRNFVLTPLLDIEPDFIHPILKKSVWELYDECKDTKEVRILE
ncbi:MAG: 2-amino-4-hydroxy-6-hydroxymethyldihydropteridine diphosphokinase [Saprospiraceae bacterium]|nr:2-amino-4-hydroxy-6-hydroxymethyldihydropteridine diphosphokinase [Saprospiraceae bacterium]